MKNDSSTPSSGTRWKDTLLGVVILVAMIGGLVYVNAFASVGETLVVGVVVAVILLLLRFVRKKQPGKRGADSDKESESN